jgi:RNA polymerase sigma-70 factor (ECF subfamily)
LRGSVEQPEPADLRSDAELVGVLASDPGALAVLYDRHAALVYGLALRSLESSDEAQDLTQEVFMSLRTDRHFDPARGSLAAYLTTVTRTRAIDRLRFRTRKVRLLRRWWQSTPTVTSAPSPHEDVASGQSAERVRRALEDLPESERRVLELAYFKGMSQTEIAERLSAPLGTVKSWSRRGLLSLRAALGDLAD